MDRRKRIIGVSAVAAVLATGLIATAVAADLSKYNRACYGTIFDGEASRISAEHLAADTPLCERLKSDDYEAIESSIGSEELRVTQGKGTPEMVIVDGEVIRMEGVVDLNGHSWHFEVNPSEKVAQAPAALEEEWLEVITYRKSGGPEPSAGIYWSSQPVNNV